MATNAAAVNPAVQKLTELLDSTWKVSLKDNGRTFIGRFVIVDRQVKKHLTDYDLPYWRIALVYTEAQQNVVLDEAVELIGETYRKNVGLIMLPGKDIATAEVDTETIVKEIV